MKNKFKIILIMLLSTIFGCNEEDKMPYYIYNTKEYKEKLNEFKINIEEASNIYAKYYFEKFPEVKDDNCGLSLIYGDSYIFSDVYNYNAKTGIYNLSGYWVNGKTGEVKFVKTDECLNIKLGVTMNSGYFKKINSNFANKD